MDIIIYLRLLWKYSWLILLTGITSFVIIFMGTRNPDMYYEAYALVRLEAMQVGDGIWQDFNLLYTDRIVNTYTTLVLTSDVRDSLEETLEVDALPEIEFDPLPNTELIQITARSGDATLAAQTATQVARAFAEQQWDSGDASQQLLESLLELQRELETELIEKESINAEDMASLAEFNQVQREVEFLNSSITTIQQGLINWQITNTLLQDTITLVEEAPIPESPAGPNNRILQILGFVVGCVGGVVIALFIEQFDDRILREEQLQTLTDAAVVGKLPRFKKSRNQAAYKQEQLKTRLFQRLQVKLANMPQPDNDTPGQDNGWQILMITSAETQAGKSFIVSELAKSFAKAKYKTLILNLTPSLLALEREASSITEKDLKGLLAGNTDIETFIQHDTTSDVYVLAHEYPVTALSLHRGKLLQTLREKFEIILIDTPAFLASEEAITLVPDVDAILPVVHLKHTRQRAFKIFQEEMADAPVIGLIINAAPNDPIIHFTQRYSPSKGLNG